MRIKTPNEALIIQLAAALKDTLAQLQKYEPKTVFVAAEAALAKTHAEFAEDIADHAPTARNPKGGRV